MSFINYNNESAFGCVIVVVVETIKRSDDLLALT